MRRWGQSGEGHRAAAGSGDQTTTSGDRHLAAAESSDRSTMSAEQAGRRQDVRLPGQMRPEPTLQAQQNLARVEAVKTGREEPFDLEATAKRSVETPKVAGDASTAGR